MNNYPYAYRSARAPVGFKKTDFTERPSSTISALPEHPVPTMAYVPFQTDMTTYDENKALRVGTLFPVLNKPFFGSGVR